jgi:hypothetical protein
MAPIESDEADESSAETKAQIDDTKVVKLEEEVRRLERVSRQMSQSLNRNRRGGWLFSVAIGNTEVVRIIR